MPWYHNHNWCFIEGGILESFLAGRGSVFQGQVTIATAEIDERIAAPDMNVSDVANNNLVVAALKNMGHLAAGESNDARDLGHIADQGEVEAVKFIGGLARE